LSDGSVWSSHPASRLPHFDTSFYRAELLAILEYEDSVFEICIINTVHLPHPDVSKEELIFVSFSDFLYIIQYVANGI